MKVLEKCVSVKVGAKEPKRVWQNDKIKVWLGKKRLLGNRCWQLAMKMQKKGVWKLTENKR